MKPYRLSLVPLSSKQFATKLTDRQAKRVIETLQVMKVNESFFITTNASQAVYQAAMYHNISIAIRRVGVGIRVWRIK